MDVPLLTEQQIQTAHRSDLLDLLRAINTHLETLHGNDLLKAVKELVQRHHLTNAAYITIGVDEWDDGYFYSSIDRVRDIKKRDIELSEDVDWAFVQTLRPHFAELSYDHAVGRFSALYVSLIDNTVRTDPSLDFLD